jgi:hypothetical protein
MSSDSEIAMKHLILGLSLVMLTVSAAAAGGFGYDLPRLDFPATGAQAMQTCNLITQTCGK